MPVGQMSDILGQILMYTFYTMADTCSYICIFIIITADNKQLVMPLLQLPVLKHRVICKKRIWGLTIKVQNVGIAIQTGNAKTKFSDSIFSGTE